MKKIEKVVELLKSEIVEKDLLEVACGGADFSIGAAGFAKNVSCIDLDYSRINGKALPENVRFEKMNATFMDYPDASFDNVFLYNAFFHVREEWGEIEKECRRVLRPGGRIIIIGTWKLDTNLMLDIFGNDAKWYGEFHLVRIE